MATKALITNANGLARFAALLAGAGLGELPAEPPVADASAEDGTEVVAVRVAVNEALLRVVLREMGMPVPPEVTAVPTALVPTSIAVVTLAGTMVVWMYVVLTGAIAESTDERVAEIAAESAAV